MRTAPVSLPSETKPTGTGRSGTVIQMFQTARIIQSTQPIATLLLLLMLLLLLLLRI